MFFPSVPINSITLIATRFLGESLEESLSVVACAAASQIRQLSCCTKPLASCSVSVGQRYVAKLLVDFFVTEWTPMIGNQSSPTVRILIIASGFLLLNISCLLPINFGAAAAYLFFSRSI